MIIMEGRYDQLQNTLEGWKRTDVPLVSWNPPHYEIAGFTDDLGIYYFVPGIAKTFGISIDSAINLFFGSLLGLGVLISFLCFWLFFRDGPSRLISFIGHSLLAVAAFRYSDVYLAPYFAVTAIIPFFLLLRSIPRSWWIRLALSGLVIGYCNLIRSHAGTGVLLFLLTWIGVHRDLSKRAKGTSLLTLLAFVAIPYLHFHALEAKRDQFLSQKGVAPASISHPKWHSIYIGLGYLKNPYGIQYSDCFASEKVRSMDPKVPYCSPEYEKILKQACFSLLKTDPLFILKNLAAKILSLCFKVLLFMNLGLVFWFYVKPPLRAMAPFLVSALFYALPGVLVMPWNIYLSGFISLLTLFGIYLIGLGMEKLRFSRKYA